MRYTNYLLTYCKHIDTGLVKETDLSVCVCVSLLVSLHVFIRLSCVAVYHCKCIDTWLVEDSDLCPLCKKSVIDNDSDQEAAAAAAGVSSSTAPSTSGSAAAAATNVSGLQDDDDEEDAPLLRAPSRHRPRHYGSRLRGNSASVHVQKLRPTML